MKDELIEKAKEVSIVDILTEIGIPFKFVGSKAAMICPFHEEYNGSLIINDDNTYHCFGCGVHGDSINLVRTLLGLSFIEAVEFINLIGHKIK